MRHTPSNPPYVVLVELLVERERSEEFLQLLLQNASSSLELEAGCQVFDVCQEPDDAGRFLLYEVYDSEAAFQHHLATLHFTAFNQQTEPFTLSKIVRVFSRCELNYAVTARA